MMPFGVNSDPSFRAQKKNIRVRVSSFRTAETVVLHFLSCSSPQLLCVSTQAGTVLRNLYRSPFHGAGSIPHLKIMFGQHESVFKNLLGVPRYWAFPFTGRANGLAAAAPGHGKVALGTKKVARTWTGAGPGTGGPDPAPLSSPPTPLCHGLAPPPPSHGQISKWKRPVNGNAIWGGVGVQKLQISNIYPGRN